MKILFENNSKIESLEVAKSSRGYRSNLISCICFDFEKECWCFVEDLDMTKLFDRFVPEWVVCQMEDEIYNVFKSAMDKNK